MMKKENKSHEKMSRSEAEKMVFASMMTMILTMKHLPDMGLVVNEILEALNIAIEALEQEPVKHGKWISGEDMSKNYFYRRCTNCLKEIPNEIFCFKFDVNYCPHCGAKMEGVEK